MPVLQTTVSQWFTSLTQNIFRAGTAKHLAHLRKWATSLRVPQHDSFPVQQTSNQGWHGTGSFHAKWRVCFQREEFATGENTRDPTSEHGDAPAAASGERLHHRQQSAAKGRSAGSR